MSSARSASITGTSCSICESAPTRSASRIVDSAPMSIRSAPCAASTRPRAIADSTEGATLSRYHESRDMLTTPMIAGAASKSNSLPPMSKLATGVASSPSCSAASFARSASVSIGLLLRPVQVRVAEQVPLVADLDERAQVRRRCAGELRAVNDQVGRRDETDGH